MIDTKNLIEVARKKDEESRLQKHKRKLNAFNQLIELLEQPVENLLNKYEDTYFTGTKVSKKEIFTRTVTVSLTKKDIDFLNNAVTGLTHHRDRRYAYEYCIDLIFGWLIEDAVVNKIAEQNIPVVLSGADANRDFLKMKDIDTSPDIKIGTEDNSRLVEVFCDWTDFWNLKGKADLRDNKYKRLQDDNAILLGLAPLSRKGFLFDVSTNNDFVYNNIIPAYGKPGYTCDRIGERLKTIEEVLLELINKFN